MVTPRSNPVSRCPRTSLLKRGGTASSEPGQNSKVACYLMMSATQKKVGPRLSEFEITDE